MPQLIANNARALLTADILAAATSISIEVAKADTFPVANTGTDPVPTVGKDYFKAVLQKSTGEIEIIYVRTRAAGIAILSNVIRGQEGTTALDFLAGSVVGLRITAMDLQTSVALKTDLAAAGGAALVGNTPAGNIAATSVQAALNELDAEKAALSGAAFTGAVSSTTAEYNLRGRFNKADTNSVAFTKTGAGTISIKAGTTLTVSATLLTFAAATAVVMPALTAGVDYAIYAATDGTVRADANFSAPAGYTTANSRKIGGFHYAAGDNAADRAGGNTTPNINAFSLWDLKFKPSASDPRGMALIGGKFWSDIYLLGVDHHTNGTSKYNVSIADGSSAVKIPTAFGGNGTLTYTTLTWWEANEVLAAYGKRSPRYDEFAGLAFGATEATSSGGTDVPTTGVTGTGATSAWNIFTSKWGVIQAAGCLWSWGNEFGGGTGTAAWTANTGGRGSTYQLENAVLFGGVWADGANSGSRCSNWNNAPTLSSGGIGVRGVSDHLILE